MVVTDPRMIEQRQLSRPLEVFSPEQPWRAAEFLLFRSFYPPAEDPETIARAVRILLSDPDTAEASVLHWGKPVTDAELEAHERSWPRHALGAPLGDPESASARAFERWALGESVPGD
jgi:hypothetical protein